MQRQEIERALIAARQIVTFLEGLYRRECGEAEATPSLSLEQSAILCELRGVSGNNKIARKAATTILKRLETEKLRATESFVYQLKTFFDEREWGVSCLTCKEPATLVWLRKLHCAEGGAMSFGHYSDGKRMIHCSRTTIPPMEIVIRRDLRRRQR